MTDGNFICSLCGKNLATEYEAVAHTCNQEPPEPTMADIPMTTREAVTVLANQLANITDSFMSVADAIRQTNLHLHNLNFMLAKHLSDEYPLLYPRPQRPDTDQTGTTR